jgi:hypothetical protein
MVDSTHSPRDLAGSEEIQRLAGFVWEVDQGEVPDHSDDCCDDAVHDEDPAPPSEIGQAVHLHKSVRQYLKIINTRSIQSNGEDLTPPKAEAFIVRK